MSCSIHRTRPECPYCNPKAQQEREGGQPSHEDESDSNALEKLRNLPWGALEDWVEQKPEVLPESSGTDSGGERKASHATERIRLEYRLATSEARIGDALGDALRCLDGDARRIKKLETDMDDAHRTRDQRWQMAKEAKSAQRQAESRVRTLEAEANKVIAYIETRAATLDRTSITMHQDEDLQGSSRYAHYAAAIKSMAHGLANGKHLRTEGEGK